ncbi:MAG: hypothetical protein EP344_18830 [Bacteroidetes bacterium]|nr:MAG: hypothetical protein EP344_18830 [Bacteroidota bacterium]
MPKEVLHIFTAFNPADLDTANGLYQHLIQGLTGYELKFWNPSEVAEEDFRKQANNFLEKTQLFIACLSPHYLETPNNRWALEKALSEQKRRKDFQILVALAQAAFVPEQLTGFPLSPEPEQPIEGFSLSRDIQLRRVAQRARDLLLQIDRSSAGTPVIMQGKAYQMQFEDVRERLIVWSEQYDLAPLFLFLKRLLHPESTPDAVFQLEDAFAEWRQQAQRSKLTFDIFQKTVQAIRLDLQHLIGLLKEEQFNPNWTSIFAQTYYGLAPVEVPADPLSGIFLPMGEVHAPMSLNTPVDEQTGASLLSAQQQQEFKRNLLLAQDAMGIGNFSRAHALCEHVQTHIDPQSAQLYELLLLSYLKKETPDRIISEAIDGRPTKLNHVVVYAGRFSEYQRYSKCPSEAGTYNLKAVAEALSNALLRLYSSFNNDYILQTGRYGQEVPDNRTAISNCVQVAMEIYRTVHPYRGFLELAVNELCNGGKYDYIRQVEIIQDEFRFASHEDFGIESEIREIIGMLEAISPDDDDALMNRQLRENLFFNLKAKRHRLQVQLAEEKRRFLQFTDLRDAVVELIQAMLLGYKIYGDQDYPDEESLLRLAVEQLLPGLLLPRASGTPAQSIGDLRWFHLDASGNVSAHPDCAAYRFDPVAVVEKITKDHTGQAGWLQVRPNIKAEVFLQFVADTDAAYQAIGNELKWTDIRRPDETDARFQIIQCLQNWKKAYFADPDRGDRYIQQILQELVGNRLLLWIRFEPPRLTTIPESLGLGYLALREFKEMLGYSESIKPEQAYQFLAHNLFTRHIRPSFEKITLGDPAKRQEAISLLLQALHNFRDLHEAPEYLEFVYEEITREQKYQWLDITEDGSGISVLPDMTSSFDPVDILQQLARISPERFRLLEARRRIAHRRFSDLKHLYLQEISEFTSENRQIERRLAIDIIRKLKGLFLYYPDAEFLELPIRELSGHGRIRWKEYFLGVFPARSNHYENRYFNFDYRQELSEFRMYKKTHQQWMEHVLRQTNDIP